MSFNTCFVLPRVHFIHFTIDSGEHLVLHIAVAYYASCGLASSQAVHYGSDL